MATNLSALYSTLGLTTANSGGGVSLDDSRRTFALGESVVELQPEAAPFLSFLTKVGRKPTPDPVFKFREQRHQWQRRNALVATAYGTTAPFDTLAHIQAAWLGGTASGTIRFDCLYDVFGRVVTTATAPQFMLPNQLVTFRATLTCSGGTSTAWGAATGTVVPIVIKLNTLTTNTAYHQFDFYIVSVNGRSTSATGDATTVTLSVADNAAVQVIGSAFAEGSDTPSVSWKDELWMNEGFTQIFKTASPLMSGTALSTEYAGYADEFARIWLEKIQEHKMDIENGMLFGVGTPGGTETGNPATTASIRTTWGILPYIERYGNVFSVSYTGAGYDDLLTNCATLYDPAMGGSRKKLWLCSANVLNWLNKLGDSSFLGTTIGRGQYQFNVQNIMNSFGFIMTKVTNVWGEMYFVYNPLLRGPYEDYACAIDMAHVKYRYLNGNGKSRDTMYKTNVQDNGVDGRVDEILTEAGLEISMPELHAVVKFS